MRFDQNSGTNIDSLAIKAGGEALTDPKTTVLSCGGINVPCNHLPSKPLLWKEIMSLPSAEMSQRLFGLEPVLYEWNPYLEEAIYEN